MLAPHVDLQPLSRWIWGPLSIPCRPGTSAYMLQERIRGRAYVHVLPRVLQLWTMPPCLGELQWCRMAHGSRPRLRAQEGSGATTCSVTWNLTSPRLRGGGALALPCVPWLWIPPLFPRGSVAATYSWLSMGHGNKERHSCTRRAARHAYYRGTPTHCRGACKTCGQMTLS
jgi:hypothetical protein